MADEQKQKPVFPVGELQADHPRLLGRPSRSINDEEYKMAAKLDGTGVDDDHPSTEPGSPVPVMRDEAVPHASLPDRARLEAQHPGAEPLPMKAIGEIKPTRARPVDEDRTAEAAGPEIIEATEPADSATKVKLVD